MPLGEDDTRDIVIEKLSDRDFPEEVKTDDTLTGYEKEHTIHGRKYYSQIENPKNGSADIIYWFGEKIVTLVEVKREGRFENEDEIENAYLQAKSYAFAEEFKVPPPFIIVSDGNVLNVWRRENFPNGQQKLFKEYEDLDSFVPPWEECVDYEMGEFEKEYVQAQELNEILRNYSKPLRNDLEYAYENLGGDEKEELDIKIKKRLPGQKKERTNTYLTNSVLNLMNKVLFLKILESRERDSLLNLFEYITQSFSEEVKKDKLVLLTPALFRNKKRAKEWWNEDVEKAWEKYVTFYENASDFSVVSLLYAAFAIEETQLPGIYKSTFYDELKPSRQTIEELLQELVEVKVSVIGDRAIGETYQEFLREERARRKELGSYYTPENVCSYLVNEAELDYNHKVMECAAGTGHILSMIIDEMTDEYLSDHSNTNWLNNKEKYKEKLNPLKEEASEVIVDNIFAGDIDNFATQLTWIRMYLKGFQDMALNIRQRDYLASRNEYQKHLWKAKDVGTEKDLGDIHAWDRVEFDRIIANPPYNTSPPDHLQDFYKKIYKDEEFQLGSNDSYGFFLARAIDDLDERGKLSFIVSDTFLTITTHSELREYILENCRINEITLMPSDVFKPYATTANTCIIILEKTTGSNKQAERENNEIKLSRNLRTEHDYWQGTPTESEEIDIKDKASYKTISQSWYYEPDQRHPFFIPLDRDWKEGTWKEHLHLLNRAWDPKKNDILQIEEVTEGGAGLQTGNNDKYVKVLKPQSGYNNKISSSEIANNIHVDQKFRKHVPDCGKISRRINRIFNKSRPNKVRANDIRYALVKKHTKTEGGDYVPFFLGGEVSNRSYYGDNNFFIKWTPDNLKEIIPKSSSRPQNMQFYFREGFVTDGVNGNVSARYVNNGIPPVNTNLFCTTTANLYYVIGLLNSDLYIRLLNTYINSTLIGMSSHITPKDVRALPYLVPTDEKEDKIVTLVKKIIDEKKKNGSYDFSQEQQEIDETVYQIYERVLEELDVK